MDVNDGVQACRMYVRRSTWMEDPDWRRVLNAAAQDLQKQTRLLVAEFRVQLQEGVLEYDMSSARMSNMTGNGWMGEDPIYLVTRDYMINKDREEEGEPKYVYPIGTFTIGVYPVPSAVYDGQYLYVFGEYWPDPITTATAGTTELPFEEGDHDTLVMGAVLRAQLIDRDIQVASAIAELYASGLSSMKSRANRRLSATGMVKRYGT